MRKDQVIACGTADPYSAAFDPMLDRGKGILPDQLRGTSTLGTLTKQLRGIPPVFLISLDSAALRLGSGCAAALRAPFGSQFGGTALLL